MNLSNRLSYSTIFSYLFFILCITFNSAQASNDKKLKVGVLNYPPISSIDHNEESPVGFGSDLAKLLAEIMDRTAQIYTFNNSDLLKALNDGKIDVAIGIMDYSYSTKVNYIITPVQVIRSYFINSRCSTFFSTDDLPGHTVAIEKGHILTQLLSSHENIKYIETKSQEDALSLVDSGEADVYISKDGALTNHIIDKNGFRSIKRVTIPYESVPLVIAVNKKNQQLLTSLSIAYSTISEDERLLKIYQKWIHDDFQEKILKYRFHIILTVFFLIFATFLFISRNSVLKKKVKKITQNLQISEQRYRDLIESSPDMIHLISQDGEIRLANKISKKQLGYINDKSKINKLQNFVVPEQENKIIDFIKQVFLDKYSNNEFTLVKNNGSSISVEMVATLIEGVGNNEKLACCFSRDLSERKRLEEKLIYSDRLAIMGQMAAGIAHEINNPLWIVLSNTEDMLSHQLSPKEMDECLRSIERNGLRAAKSIEDLLSFARPSPIKIENIDLTKLIDDSLIFLQRKLKKKNICIEKLYSSESIILQCDENSIQQLFINIILNAIQASDIGSSILISISLSENSSDGRIIVEIKDHGKGIPAEKLKNIFSPFYTFGKSNGFGLGLFLSKIIVDKHNGDLSVKSRLGEGTVIGVSFPRKTKRTSGPQEPLFKEPVHE